MKILILGAGESGKTTAANYLRDRYGLSFTDSSLACAEVILPVLNAARGSMGAPPYINATHAHQDRRNCRMLWKECIALYNAADPSALTRLILSKCDLYVGMRAKREYEASRGLFDAVLYLRRGGLAHDPSMGIDYDLEAMWLVDAETIEGQRAQLDKFIRENDQL